MRAKRKLKIMIYSLYYKTNKKVALSTGVILWRTYSNIIKPRKLNLVIKRRRKKYDSYFLFLFFVVSLLFREIVKISNIL